MANKQGNPCIRGTGFDSVLLICIPSRMKSVGKIPQLLKNRKAYYACSTYV